MQSRILSTRIALLTGGVLAATSFFPVLGLATAHADEQTERRSKQYKTGAIVLGAAAAYLGLKSKKTIPAVVAGAGAYYAYKKSQDLKNQSDRYGYGLPNGNQDIYPDDNGYSAPYDGGDANYPEDNGYGTSPYPTRNGGYEYDNGSYAGFPGGDYPDYAGLQSRTKTNAQKKRVAVK